MERRDAAVERGDGNRTRTVSLEGFGSQEPFVLVSAKSRACRAFACLNANLGPWKRSSLSLGQRPVECSRSWRLRPTTVG
jgi:hypothetical protein